jgi:hypothetical protein
MSTPDQRKHNDHGSGWALNAYLLSVSVAAVHGAS